jgi:hypothetical protein
MAAPGRILLATLAFALLAHSLFAQEATVATLHLVSFSAVPQTIAQDGSLQFQLSLKSYSTTADKYSAKISVYDRSGSQLYSVVFQPTTIAGGETQDLSVAWSAMGMQPGTYTVEASVSDGVATEQQRLFFYIAAAGSGESSPPASQQPPAAGQNAFQQECSEPQCGNWTSCQSGYQSRDCQCAGQSFSQVQICSLPEPQQQPVPRFDALVCCLPIGLLALLFAALLVRKRIRARRQRRQMQPPVFE